MSLLTPICRINRKAPLHHSQSSSQRWDGGWHQSKWKQLVQEKWIQAVSTHTGLRSKAPETGKKKWRSKLEGVREKEEGKGSKNKNSSSLQYIYSLGHTHFCLAVHTYLSLYIFLWHPFSEKWRRPDRSTHEPMKCVGQKCHKKWRLQYKHHTQTQKTKKWTTYILTYISNLVWTIKTP